MGAPEGLGVPVSCYCYYKSGDRW